MSKVPGARLPEKRDTTLMPPEFGIGSNGVPAQPQMQQSSGSDLNFPQMGGEHQLTTVPDEAARLRVRVPAGSQKAPDPEDEAERRSDYGG